MPRYHDDGDRPRRRRKPGRGRGPAWGLIAGIAAGVMVILATAVIAVVLVKGKKGKDAATAPATAPEDTRPAAGKGKGAFTVGKDTTRVTGPLDATGHIDYVAALNDRLKQGVTPETNAAVLLCRAIGPRPESDPIPDEYYRQLGIKPLPDGGSYFISYARFVGGNAEVLADLQSAAARFPWSATQYPDLARWLDANEKPLALVVEASKRPHYFSPLVRHETGSGPAAFLETRLPTVQRCRQLAQALQIRAMFRADGGQPDAAWQDLLACHRLARLVGRGGPLIEGLVGYAMDIAAHKTDAAFLDRAGADAELLDRCQRDLRDLPALPDVAEKMDLGERFSFLDNLMMLDRNGLAYLQRLGNQNPQRHPLADLGLDGIDWDPALRVGNEWFDRIVAGLRQPDRRARQVAWDRIDADLRALKTGLNLVEMGRTIRGAKDPAKAKGEAVGNILVTLMFPAANKVQDAADRAAQGHQNVAVAVALARYRLDAGRYPADLSELAPKYLPAVPADLFTGRPPVYRPGGAGYLLYSVGVNGQDDGGRGYDATPPGDDLDVRAPVPDPRRP